MRRWEYDKIDLNQISTKVTDIDVLWAAGREGWELVAVTPNAIAFLKREVLEGPAKAANPRAKT